MDLSQLLLATHLLGAIGWGSILAAAAVVLVRSLNSYYSPLAKLLGAATGVQLVSGALMLLAHPDQEPLAFCGRIGLYLAVTTVGEFALYYRVRQQAQPFPLLAATGSLAIGMVVTSAAFFSVFVF